MPITLNHIGVAVKDLPALQKLFGLLGLTITATESVPEQGVKTHFLPLPVQPASIELLEVTDPTGTVAGFIAKRGPGIHHLSFTVERGELDPLMSTLKAEGYRFTYEHPRSGAHNMRINFIHPSTAGGMLIELMEPAQDPEQPGAYRSDNAGATSGSGV
ncbi:MAG: VOC family protein [Cryobacterium sp.]|nr:VOC family protein [Oligoflexia bacterium]